jgi:hypothetical protein
MKPRGWGGRRCALAGAVAMTVALAACNLIQPLDPSLEAGFLTKDGNDDYGITVVDGNAISSAPITNEGANTRVAFWPAGASQTLNQQSCTSWVEDDHFTQQGVALRVRSVDGRTTAITVTKNIWFSGYWMFNVHVMDSGNTEQPFTQIASFDLSGAVVRDGAPAPSPWRLCARVVGDLLALKVWAADEAEPAWMDGVHGGGVMLPAGWDPSGAAGWYVGHLRPGVSTTYTAREVLDLDTPEAATDLPAESSRQASPLDVADGSTPPTTVPYLEPTDIDSAP